MAKPPVPMDDDHLSICKLETKNDQLYKNMQMIIEGYLTEQPDESDSEKKKSEELSSHIPWFYYTIDHDYLSHCSFADHFKEKNIFVGFFEGQLEDKPYSFAAHYYTLLNKTSMREDIRGKVLPIQLDGAGKSSFRNGLHKHVILDRAEIDPDLQIENWLRKEQTLVLYSSIKVEKKSAVIIEGAIEYLQRLSIHNVRVAVLFSGTEHPEKLPNGCNDMSVLRALQADDIECWLDEGYESEKINLNSKKALKQELSTLLTGTKPTYREAFSVLENYHLPC